MHEHRRQFLIGPRPVLVRSSWTSIPLDSSGSLHLSYCSELPVVAARPSADAPLRVLVGDAIDTVDRALTPEQQLQQAPADDALLRDARGWAGRWLLVLDGAIHLDACGMLGCLYRRDDVDGRLWASSSPALLRIAELGPADPYVAPPIRHQVGIDFYPAPMTRYGSIQRLLPSQVLDVRPTAPATLMPRLLPEPIDGARAEQDVLEELGERLKQGMRSAARRWPKLWLPLTGGHDSRVLVAAAHAAGIDDVTTYTHSLPWPRFSRADRKLPPMVAAAAGYEHRLIEPRPLEARRIGIVDRHTAASTTGPDRSFIAHQQWDPVPLDAGVLRGTCFEVTNCAYYKRSAPPDWVANEPQAVVAPPSLGLESGGCADQLFDAFNVAASYPHSRPHVLGLQQWCTWETLHPTRTMDWRDRFYLEQRMGAWASAVEQQLDVTGTNRIAPFNCHDLIATALALPDERRQWRWWQADLVSRLAPDVARIPCNTPNGALQRIAERAGNELHLLRSAQDRPQHVRARIRRVLARRRLVRTG